MTNPRQLLAALATISLAGAGPARAQRQPLALDRAIRAELIDQAAGALERTYIEADTGQLIAAAIRKRLASGAYDRLENPAQFADQVTRDLRSVNGDLHLGLRYSPEPSGPSPLGRGDPSERNFGMGRAEILDGNVGYLEITGFMGAPGYRDAVVDALRFLSRTEALIIDVRRNGGGSGEMSHLVFSHFLGSDPVPTIRVKRREGEPVVRESFAEVPGPRRPDVPLYLLTSQGTGSAAEEFSFVLKNLGRARIVGSRTAGAGHMVTGVPLSRGFAISVSITRVMDARSGKEWEGTGVIPDLDVDPADALDAAHEAALVALAASASGSKVSVLERLAETVRARRTAVTPGPLDGLAGDYEGRVVSLRDGVVYYARRRGALPEALVPLGGRRFGLGATRYQFEPAAGGTRLTIELPDGTSVSFLSGKAGAE
ncbi:MAG: S41 family peptidase [Gemmatimonadales bacterium]